MEKSSSSCKVEGCPNHPRYCGFCDRHYREQKHRPYKKRGESKLFDLLPEATKRKLCKPKRMCCICKKALKYPNIVLYKYTHKMCKECFIKVKGGKE